MAEEWYPYLAGKVGYYDNGFLKIGTLRFSNPIEYKFMYVFSSWILAVEFSNTVLFKY
jgi:hypothetical protein